MMRIRVYCPRISSFNVEQYESSSNVEIPFENFNIDSSSSGGDYYREKGAREKNVLIFWNFWNCVKVKAPLVSHVSAGHESCRRRRCCFKKMCAEGVSEVSISGKAIGRKRPTFVWRLVDWTFLWVSKYFGLEVPRGLLIVAFNWNLDQFFCIIKKKSLVPKLVPIDDGCCPNRGV